MAMFRKKPVVIEAVQVVEGVQNFPNDWPVEQWGYTTNGIVIPTLEGDHLARVGDWIIRGVQGEFYPCKPDIFAATYEPVDAPRSGT